jgi:hypothetical protein
MPTKPAQKPVATVVTMTAMDDLATGRDAAAYRVRKRVKLRELAPRLKTPTGAGMSIDALCRYEHGDRKWTAELLAKYVQSVDTIADNF